MSAITACLADEIVYFPEEVYEKTSPDRPGATDFFTQFADWFKDGKQPSLWQQSSASKCTEFRVFDRYELLPINCPIVRLHVNKDGTGIWIFQIVHPNYMKPTGEDIDKPYGKPLTKTYKVSKKKVSEFLALVERNKAFWHMPVYIQEFVADGKDSFLECVVNGKYHVVRRNGFSKGPMKNIGNALLNLVKVSIKDVPELIDKGENK